MQWSMPVTHYELCFVFVLSTSQLAQGKPTHPQSTQLWHFFEEKSIRFATPSKQLAHTPQGNQHMEVGEPDRKTGDFFSCFKRGRFWAMLLLGSEWQAQPRGVKVSEERDTPTQATSDLVASCQVSINLEDHAFVLQKQRLLGWETSLVCSKGVKLKAHVAHCLSKILKQTCTQPGKWEDSAHSKQQPQEGEDKWASEPAWAGTKVCPARLGLGARGSRVMVCRGVLGQAATLPLGKEKNLNR